MPRAGCGMRLRGDDPVGMKNFIISVQSRVNELKAASENGQSNLSSKRVMHGLVLNYDFLRLFPTSLTSGICVDGVHA